MEKRFDLKLPVKIRHDREVVQATTIDVSSRGVYLHLPFPVAANGQVEYEMFLPAELCSGVRLRLSCRGRVVRVDHKRDGRIGVAAVVEDYNCVDEPAIN